MGSLLRKIIFAKLFLFLYENGDAGRIGKTKMGAI